MHVGINALFFEPGLSGGSETYLRELVPRMVASRPDVQFTLVCGSRGAQALRAEGWQNLLMLAELPANDDERLRKLLAGQIALPMLARHRRMDVLHSLANLSPIHAGVPSVLTLLDVTYATHDTMSWISRAGTWEVVKRAAPRADHVITISEAARRDILAQLPALDGKKVTTIPLGRGRAPQQPASQEAVRERLGLGPGPLVLCVAALRRHKNQALLARALALLGADAQLVCAGRAEGYEDEVLSAAREAGVADRVHVTGYLDSSVLEGLYALAAACALPTRAEGFGLPVLEAMSRGVPVACSDLPVLREVAGDCAAYFDPDDPADAARAIERAIGSTALRACGGDRANAFSWDATAAATLEVYQRVCTSA